MRSQKANATTVFVWSSSVFVFLLFQRWEPFRKWHHIQAGASILVRAALLPATDQSKVFWGVWFINEAPSLWEASVYLLLTELGGHGQPLLDQTVHRGTGIFYWGHLIPYSESVRCI